MASRSLNRIMLIGNLTRDPELKYTPSGTAVCSFGIATNRSWKTQDGSTKEETQFHRIIAWQKLAELCGKLLSKGRKVFLEGRLVYRTFAGRDGVQRTVSEIVLDDFIVFGDGRKLMPEESSPTPTEELSGEVNPSDEMEISEKKDELKENLSSEKAKKPVESNKSEEVNPDDIPF